MTKKNRIIIIAVSISLFALLVAYVLFVALYEGAILIDDNTWVVKMTNEHHFDGFIPYFDTENATSKEWAVYFAKQLSGKGTSDQSILGSILSIGQNESWKKTIEHGKVHVPNYYDYDKILLVDVFTKHFYIFAIYNETDEPYESVGLSMTIDKKTGEVLDTYYGEWAL